MTKLRQSAGSIATILGGLVILAGLAYLGFFWLRILLTALQVLVWFLWHWGWLLCLLALGVVFAVRWRRRSSHLDARD